MKDLSMDLKNRAIALFKEGISSSKVAQRLLISKSSANRIRNYWRDHGAAPVSRRKGKTATLLAGCEDSLREWVRQHPEITLEELSEKLLEQSHVKASVSSIWRKLHSLGPRHKKNGFRGRARPS